MNSTKKGEMVPQTIENLQAIMAKDAAVMEALDREITLLRVDNERLRMKIKKREK
jgi:hypothetical protein